MAPETLLRGASSSFAQGWTRGRRSGREIVGCSRSVPVLCQCLVREGHEAFGVKAVICSSVTPMRRSSKAHVRFVAWFSSCDVYTTSPFMSTKKDYSPRGGRCPLIADRGGIRLDLRGSRFRRRIWMTDVNVRAPHGKPVQKSGEGTDDEYRNQSNEDNEHLTAQFCSPWGLLSRGLRCLEVLGERLRRLRLGCLRAAVRGVQRLGYRATRGGGGSSLLMSCFYHTRTLSMTPWPPRPRHEEAGTNALISLSVMPISMSSKTQVRRVAFLKSFVEEDEPSAVLMM